MRSTTTPSSRRCGASLPAVTPLPRDVFDGASAERRLAGYFAVATVDAFGALSRLELTAAAACVTYVERTQLGKRPPLSPPTREAAGATLAIDAATRANLELMRTQAGERRGSLIDAIDRTLTVAGARLLAQRLAAPLTDPAAIGRRLDAVGLFVSELDLARRPARAPQGGARSRPRAGAARGRPRRTARSRRDPRRLARGCRDRRAAGGGPAGRRNRRCRRRPAAARPSDRGRACGGARRGPAAPAGATAALSRRITTPRSTRPARCATARAGSSPRCRRAMPRRRRSGHSRSATTTSSAISSRSRRSMATGS